MRKFSEVKPSADIEYLSSAIIRDAVFSKFRNLFGRDPVAKDIEQPMKVDNTRVPDLIASSVDSDIAKMLKASAIESSKNASGEIPEINNATLIYIILDDIPAEVPLASVEEYVSMDTSIADVTVEAVSEQEDINIENNVAYLSSDLSTIDIGVFVDNELFAQEFQYLIENAGGEKLESDEKVKIFDELLEDLPGGDNVREENLRDDLLKVVGLTTEVTPEEEVSEKNKAPGPEAEAEISEKVVEPTLSSIIEDSIEKIGFRWKKISASLKKEFDFDKDNLILAEKVYLSKIALANKLSAMYTSNKKILEIGSVVISTKHDNKKFSVIDIVYGDKDDPDIVIEDSITCQQTIVNESDIEIY